MTPKLIDPFARAITYLRVSVTDRCDFRCVYCMAENMTFLPKKELLTLEDQKIAKGHGRRSAKRPARRAAAKAKARTAKVKRKVTRNRKK